MSGGTLFANANIIMQSDAKLVTRKRIREMAAAKDREAFLRVLQECGYDTNYEDDIALLAAERTKTLQTFAELCDDEALVACVTAYDHWCEDNSPATFATIAANVSKLKTSSLRHFFTTLADLTNVRTYYKGGKTLVPGGTLASEQLNIYPKLSPEALQATIDARLDELAAVDKDDIFKPNPLFWWYWQKQKEFIIVKTLLIRQHFNYDTAWVQANLKGVYEQFQ